MVDRVELLEEDLKGLCHILHKKIVGLRNNYFRRLNRLKLIIEGENIILLEAICQSAKLQNKRGIKRRDYREKSFLILSTQCLDLLEHWSKSTVIIENSKPNKNWKAEDWEEYLINLEEDFEEVKRQVNINYLQKLQMLLAFIDSLAKLVEIGKLLENNGIQSGEDQPSLFYLAEGIRIRLSRALNRRGIHEISINPGEYPPFDTTRIIARSDGGTSDNLIVDRVVEKGYTIKGELLRKAAILVTTAKEGDMEWDASSESISEQQTA